MSGRPWVRAVPVAALALALVAAGVLLEPVLRRMVWGGGGRRPEAQAGRLGLGFRLQDLGLG